MHFVPCSGNLVKRLEVELQRKLHDASTVFVDNLAEVMKRVASVASAAIGEAEPTGWIAWIGDVGPIPVGNINSSFANCIQRQENVASSQCRGSRIDLRWISLVEDVE